jgi:uncharacterized protein YjbI with pentapeptide repeats
MPQQEQEPQPHRKGPPPGWRYSAQAMHHSRFRGWLARVWRGAKNNAALVSLFGVLLTLLVTTVLAQQERERQVIVENQRAKGAQLLAEQQAQDEALQTYLGDMGELILRDTSPLPEASPDDPVSRLARAKTLTVLDRLDSRRKSGLLQFLVEAQLIQRVEKRAPIITLSDADLSGADMRDANLRGAKLVRAKLVSAYLRNANLSGAYLSDADLSDADLSGAYLNGANLSAAVLSSADLSDADLSGAKLSGAYLNAADLSYANLSGAQSITSEELEQQAASLKGATMPNGQKYEDWLKSKNREEGGKNE